jgi:hypothetical protein
MNGAPGTSTAAGCSCNVTAKMTQKQKQNQHRRCAMSWSLVPPCEMAWATWQPVSDQLVIPSLN